MINNHVWRCPRAPRYALALPRMERVVQRNLCFKLKEDKKVLVVLIDAYDESVDDPAAFDSLQTFFVDVILLSRPIICCHYCRGCALSMAYHEVYTGARVSNGCEQIIDSLLEHYPDGIFVVSSETLLVAQTRG